MFPFQSDQFLLHSNPNQEDIIQQDLILGHASLEGSNLANKMGKGQKHKILATTSNDEENNINNNVKKIMRKDIERQRRQHMATLYSSLRSLLPLESIKGKRSVSDLMYEAVNYIKHQKNKVQELSDKRDRLQNFSSSSAFDTGDASSDNCLQNCVTVRHYWGGVEIVISSGCREEGGILSRVLEVVLGEGLDVVRCVSTKTYKGLFHTIQSEVGDMTCVDLSGLQQKLNDVILQSRYTSE